MIKEITVTLDDNDREMLAGELPTLSELQRPYKEAGIYEYMLVKMRLIDAVENLDYTSICIAMKQYNELPTEVKEAMQLYTKDVIAWLNISKSLHCKGIKR